jgi:hypothetical protein
MSDVKINTVAVSNSTVTAEGCFSPAAATVTAKLSSTGSVVGSVVKNAAGSDCTGFDKSWTATFTNVAAGTYTLSVTSTSGKSSDTATMTVTVGGGS